VTRLLGRYTRALAVVAAVLALTAPATATAASQPSDRAAAAPDQVVRFGSWGPLKLNMTHHNAFKTGMVSRKMSACQAGYQMTKPYQERGFVVWKGDFPKMKVKWIVVNSAVDETAAGAHVGSTLRSLRAAYGDRLTLARGSALEGDAEKGPDLWVASVRGKGGAINFHFEYGPKPGPNKTVQYIVIARKPKVYWGC
jgi:hypothetical protein